MLSRIFGKSIYLPSPGPVLQIQAQASGFQALVTVQVLQLSRCLQITVCRCLLYPVAVAIHTAVDACCICSRSGLTLWSCYLVWSCSCHLVLLSGQMYLSCHLCPAVWSGYRSVHPAVWSWSLVLFLSSVSGLVLSSGQAIALQMLYLCQVITLLTNLIRWVFDNICVRNKDTNPLKCYTTMLTWKEFERKNRDKAFEIATRICQERRTKANAWDVHNNAIFTADIVAEMNLILWEWFDDYKKEHV